MTFSKECWLGYRHAQSRSWLCLEQGYRCQLATKRYQWGGIKIMFSLFLHDAACGRRRMSPSARHKLALCVRNPGFPGRKLVFPQRRSRRGNYIFGLLGGGQPDADDYSNDFNHNGVKPLSAHLTCSSHEPDLSVTLYFYITIWPWQLCRWDDDCQMAELLVLASRLPTWNSLCHPGPHCIYYFFVSSDRSSYSAGGLL